MFLFVYAPTEECSMGELVWFDCSALGFAMGFDLMWHLSSSFWPFDTKSDARIVLSGVFRVCGHYTQHQHQGWLFGLYTRSCANMIGTTIHKLGWVFGRWRRSRAVCDLVLLLHLAVPHIHNNHILTFLYEKYYIGFLLLLLLLLTGFD